MSIPDNSDIRALLDPSVSDLLDVAERRAFAEQFDNFSARYSAAPGAADPMFGEGMTRDRLFGDPSAQAAVSTLFDAASDVRHAQELADIALEALEDGQETDDGNADAIDDVYDAVQSDPLSSLTARLSAAPAVEIISGEEIRLLEED